MVAFGKWVGRHRILILVLAVLLLVPSWWGMRAMRINYDVLMYLPDDIESMRGQDILTGEFGTGAFAMCMVEGMPDKDVASLKARIEEVPHVRSVLWKDDFADLAMPNDILPDSARDMLAKGDITRMMIFFDDTASSEATMEAVDAIRAQAGQQAFLSGMTATAIDTKNLAQKEEPIYVLLAVVCMAIVTSLFMDSYIIPLFFLIEVGMAIMYNMGTNFFLGEISYITQAVSAVLQLGVTMDYSIFLWHAYQEQLGRFAGDSERAMAHAIKATFTSVLGSSITTIAGFLALCFMEFTLGRDLGLVLAKGVCFGVVACITILPAMILTFEKAIRRTMHRSLMPRFGGLCGFISGHSKAVLAVFACILVPMIWGYANLKVYYKMDESLPRDLPSIQANAKLQDTFGMTTAHIVLVDRDLDTRERYALVDEMGDVAGVNGVIGMESLKGPAVPDDIVPGDILDTFMSDDHEIMLVSSEYPVASDEANAQVDELNAVLRRYDPNAMLVGEAPATKDLIQITDRDFEMVSLVSIGAVFLIILFVLRSFSLPVVLVATIESAIAINLGLPYYTGTVLPFVASIIVGTIQLGATVDYAILMTTRYVRERSRGATKGEAVSTALTSSISSIIVSALGFFAATFGVAVYSDIDIISSLCMLMARGAIISMVVVIFVLPALLLVLDGLVIRSTLPLRRSLGLGGPKHEQEAA